MSRLAIATALALTAALSGCRGTAKGGDTTTTPPGGVSVVVAPPTASVAVGQTRQFTATVTGTADTRVTWSVDQGGGGSVGTSGLYTAPQTTGSYTVRATSVADPTKSGSATATVSANPPAVAVFVSPGSVLLAYGGTRQFTAVVTGTADTRVTWSVAQAGGGSISAGGLYTAPQAAGTYTVVATSVADPTQSGSATASVTQNGGGTTGAFITGYYTEWDPFTYPLAQVDWSAMTHAILAFVNARWTDPPPNPTLSPYRTLEMDGILNIPGPQGMQAFAQAAHAGGVKALFALSSSDQNGGFPAAANATAVTIDGQPTTHRAQFIKDILDACLQWGYDGVDLDWEVSINWTNFALLAKELRQAADARGWTDFIITAPIGVHDPYGNMDPAEENMWVVSWPYLDQLNPMSYCGTGVWQDWYSWHFNPLFGHGPNYPVDVASTMDGWNAVGVPKSKLGVGIGFYSIAYGLGLQGQAITAPRQPNPDNWWPSDGVDGPWSYGEIKDLIDGGGGTYVWDDVAKASYVYWSTAKNFRGDMITMLSYEDPAGIAEKGAWALQNGYGGAMIWTLQDGVWPLNTSTPQNPLLTAVKSAFRP